MEATLITGLFIDNHHAGTSEGHSPSIMLSVITCFYIDISVLSTNCYHVTVYCSAKFIGNFNPGSITSIELTNH